MSDISGLRNENCTMCSLCENAEHVCLCGTGPVPAKYMIVGEAPGLGEDRTGLPFQGQSGKLLRATLRAMGVDDSQVYITNTCKCRPPENRTPSKEEIKACYTYLSYEIDTVEPEVIVTLGNSALYAVTGHSGISKYRGSELEKGGAMVIPTYHPAAVLRSPKYTNQFKNDLRKAFGDTSEKTQKFEPVIHYVMNKESLRELITHLQKASKIELNYGALDLETTTFDYWRPETKVMSMGVCVDDVHTWSIPMEHPASPWRGQSHKIVALIKTFLVGMKWVGNNWKYDNKWMRAKYGVTVNFGPDNMLIGYANDENAPHDLKYQAAVHCGAPDYAKDIVWPKKFDPVVDDINKKVAEYLKMDLKKLMKYQALDSYYTRQVYPRERGILVKDMRIARIYKHLLEKGSTVFMYIEEFGMWIDPERLGKATEECVTNRDAVLEKLNSLIPEGWCETHLSKKQLKQGFNWNSTKQLGALLFGEDGLNFPVLLRTDKGAPSTSESVLISLGADIDHPVLEGLMEYRKWTKYLNTYLEPWRAKLDENGRIHPTFKLHGTVTGRLSGEDGVHQVPRDKFIRSLPGAPAGWSFFEIDGSQIELRVVAAVACERTMLRIFATGGDIHRETAATIMGVDPKDVGYDDRKKAKAVNFGFVYGMGWRKFRQYAWEKYGIRLTEAEAKLYRKRFFEKYPDLPAWHAKMRRLVRAMGYVVSPIGRKRRLPDIYSVDEDKQASAEREAINSPVQGFGSDYVLAAFIDMVLVKIAQKDPNFETIRPVGAVHDAQYYEIRNDMLEYWPTEIKKNFDDPTRLRKWFGYEPPVAITGDCKIGTHWGDAKDWELGQPLPFTPR